MTTAAAPIASGSRMPDENQESNALRNEVLDLDPTLNALAEDALRPKEENNEQGDIQQAGCRRVGDVGGNHDLKHRYQHGADDGTHDAPPAADDRRDIGINAERDAAGWIDEELVCQERAGDT